MSLVKQFSSNVIGGYAAFAVITVVNLFITPFLINNLGDERYGLWVITFGFGQLTVLLDMGFLAAIRRFQAQAMAKNDADEVNEVFGISLRVYGLLGLFAAVLCLSAIWWLPMLEDQIKQDLIGEFRTLMVVVAAFMLLSFLRLTMTGIIFGANRVDWDRMITALQRVTYAVVAVGLILLWRADLTSPALAMLLAGLTSMTVTYLAARKLFPPLRISLGSKNSAMLKPMLGFSAFSIGIALSSILLQQVPKFMILGYLDLQSVAMLAIPLMLAGQMIQPIQALALPMFPMATRLDETGVGELYVRGSRLCVILGLSMAGPLVVFSEQLISLWVKPEFGAVWPVLAIMLAGDFFYYGQIPSIHLLTARKDIRLLSAILLLRTGIVLGGMLYLLTWTDLGMMSVAYAWAAGTVVSCGLLLPIHTCRMLKIKLSSYWVRSHLRPMLPGAILVALCLATRHYWTPQSLLTAVIELLAAGTVGLGLSYLLGFDSQDKARVKRLLSRKKNTEATG